MFSSISQELGQSRYRVRIDKQVWITFFKPENKEVVLARDTLLPLPGAPPFPGFKEAGYVLIGYSPPPSAGNRRRISTSSSSG